MLTLDTRAKEVRKTNTIAQADGIKQNRVRGWWCNLSEDVKLQTSHPYQVAIKPKQNNHGVHNQYEIMIALIKHGNCEWIFYDCDLTKHQSIYLKNLLRNSTTRVFDIKSIDKPVRKIA